MNLVIELERPVPTWLPVGSATAIFCIGACYHPEERIEQLEVLVDGVGHPPTAFGMPRPDIAARSDLPDHDRRRYRSGFWATVPVVAPRQPADITIEISVRLGSGATVTAPIGAIAVRERPRVPITAATPARSDRRLIAVCMATFEPEVSLFEAQVQSLRDQSDESWICLISDDCSRQEKFEQILQIVGDDSRFEISRSAERLGFYRNFERAMLMAPAQAELVALCDQDDRWHRDKLHTLRHALGAAQLVYSDLRLVDADGQLLRETLWKRRRNNHRNLLSLLVANTITGAAALFRREVAELALPFPDTPGFQFHDHWIALVALAAGDVSFVERPLYDYVQHAGAVFGDVTHGGAAHSRRTRLASWMGFVTRWRAAYFYGYLSCDVQARTLLLRCGEAMPARKRRALRRFLASSYSLAAFAGLAVRPLRCLAGFTETLGTETMLAQGLAWKWLVTARTRSQKRAPRWMSDAAFPAPEGFSQKRLRRWRARF